MNTSLNQGSAKIYQFPAGGRAALGGRRYGETKPAIDRHAPRERADLQRQLVPRSGHRGRQAETGPLMPVRSFEGTRISGAVGE